MQAEDRQHPKSEPCKCLFVVHYFVQNRLHELLTTDLTAHTVDKLYENDTRQLHVKCVPELLAVFELCDFLFQTVT